MEVTNFLLMDFCIRNDLIACARCKQLAEGALDIIENSGALHKRYDIGVIDAAFLQLVDKDEIETVLCLKCDIALSKIERELKAANHGFRLEKAVFQKYLKPLEARKGPPPVNRLTILPQGHVNDEEETQLEEIDLY